MATPGQLVRTMASILGIPEPTITQYDRNLAEAGLRQIRGRGTSAAEVSAEDAANLLVAILGSPAVGASIRMAAGTSKMYGSLVVKKNFSDVARFAEHGLTTLSKLPRRHSFKDALVALIDGASRGESPYIIERKDVITEIEMMFGVKVQTPHTWAEISFDNLSNNESRRYLRLVYNPVNGYVTDKITKPLDLHQERYVSYRTVRLLGTLVGIRRG
jgi:hypothetical protein